jgi:glycosyltransferase involved in cell wall biosynthesis
MRIAVTGPADLSLLLPHLRGQLPATPGLSSPIVSEIAIELVRRGHHVTIVTLSPHERDHGVYEGADLPSLTVLVGPYRPRLRWPDAFRVERRWIRDSLEKLDVELVHAHWTYEFALGALASGRPTLVTVRDWGPKTLRYHRHPYRLVRLGMQRMVLRNAPHLTVNSPYIAELVGQRPGRTVRVIPNGLRTNAARPSPRVGEGLVVGALNSGFSNLKNVSTLLRAFAVVRQSTPDSRLRLGGADFGAGEAAERWAGQAGCVDGVEFVGRIPSSEVPSFMRSLDLFVHPSLEESFGMVLLEAINEGVPVIGGRASGAVPWVLADGQSGLLVDVRSPQQLASAVLRLAADDVERARLAGQAFHRLCAEFSLGAIVDRYEDEYRQVLDRSV